MAKPPAHGGGGGIPSGLNRIRTRPAAAEEHSSSDGDEPSPASRRGVHKGRKIARWLSSYLSPKSLDKHTYSISSSSEDRKSETSKYDKNISSSPIKYIWKLVKRKQPLSKSNFVEHASCPPKSFSHELGLRVGSPPRFQLQTRSFSDLKEIFVSLDSKFDGAKEKINAELIAFARDVDTVLQKGSLLEAHRTAEELLKLSQECIKMPPSEFRDNCERMVQNVVESRQQCQSVILEKLITRLLFILTRCTRILQFQKISGQMNQNSFERFKKCLDDVPAIEMEWVLEHADATFDVDKIMEKGSISRHSEDQHLFESSTHTTENFMDDDAKSIHAPSNKSFLFNKDDAVLPFHHNDQSVLKDPLIESSQNLVQEQEKCPKELDVVMCRICEENVPANHLESHSYLCAYAEECDSEGFDVDGRLHRIADILEHIMESYNRSFNALCVSPKHSRLQSADSIVISEVQSPRVQEWHNKGTEGMFEDLHEMDTSRIDDSHVAASNIFKSLLALKLGACNATNPCGSLTPASSSNTPRSGHFDLFWLEHNNPSELEDADQMIKLADLAHKVANIEFADGEACVSLVMCLQDLLAILQKNQIKALVIDTFGLRIKKLLKEKYLLFSEEVDEKTGENIQNQETRGFSILHSSRKDRTSIDDFDIIKQISRGAFGKVFLARKRTTGDLFAIKVLKKLDMIRKNDIERILAERDILITVRNPFVVRFFYSFTCRDNLYLVMEYLNGGDLYSLLKKVGCLEEKIARIYVAELVLALEYLHSLEIVHRDIKPDNILIAPDGHMKLTDFGLSKIGLIDSAIKLARSKTTIISEAQSPHVSSLAQAIRKRKRQSAIGTPDYLAPEILLGTGHGCAADWWSMGIILFELITGIPPFTGRSPEIIFDNILNRRIPWPDVPEDMSFEAKDLIDRLLTQDEDLRLGANGALEVKEHPFFKEIHWGNLALQKAAFVPCPESEDDTSYFMSRYQRNFSETPNEEESSYDASATSSSSHSGLVASKEECNEELDVDYSIPVDLSSINFSFKNLSQLASINYDVLLQSGKTSKCSSPSNVPRP